MPLPARPEAARTARLLVDFVLGCQWCQPDDIIEAAVFMVSELVANVVQHTGARMFDCACGEAGESSASRYETPQKLLSFRA